MIKLSLNKTEIFLYFLLIFLAVCVGCKVSYEFGKRKGFDIALDTVDKILVERIKQDKGVTKLTIKGDTSIYYITKKILNN